MSSGYKYFLIGILIMSCNWTRINIQEFEDTIIPGIGEWKLLDPGAFSPRTEAISVVSNGKVYFGLGVTNDGTYLGDFFVFDPITENWEELPEFPGAKRSSATAFAIDRCIYIGTGVQKDRNNGKLIVFNDFYKFNTNTRFWSQIDSIPGPRKGSVSFSFEGNGYVLTGCSTACQDTKYPLKKDFYQFTPGIGWNRLSDFPGDAKGAANGFLIGEKFYFGGGLENDEFTGPHYENGFWEYDIPKQKWTSKTLFPGSGRDFHAAFSIGNKGYFGLGESLVPSNDLKLFQDFWEYNPMVDEWIKKKDFPFPICWTSSVSVGENGYIIAGGSGSHNNIIRNNGILEFTP